MLEFVKLWRMKEREWNRVREREHTTILSYVAFIGRPIETRIAANLACASQREWLSWKDSYTPTHKSQPPLIFSPLHPIRAATSGLNDTHTLADFYVCFSFLAIFYSVHFLCGTSISVHKCTHRLFNALPLSNNLIENSLVKTSFSFFWKELNFNFHFSDFDTNRYFNVTLYSDVAISLCINL